MNQHEALTQKLKQLRAAEYKYKAREYAWTEAMDALEQYESAEPKENQGVFLHERQGVIKSLLAQSHKNGRRKDELQAEADRLEGMLDRNDCTGVPAVSQNHGKRMRQLQVLFPQVSKVWIERPIGIFHGNATLPPGVYHVVERDIRRYEVGVRVKNMEDEILIAMIPIEAQQVHVIEAKELS